MCSFLTKQSQFEYSTTLDGEWEVRAVKNGNEVIICKQEMGTKDD